MNVPGAKTLFAPAEDTSSLGNVLAWWERRRIPFNILVGAAGIVSMTVFLCLSTGDLDSPALSVVGFGIFANVFYTGGWIVEGLALAIRKHGSDKIGPRLFKLGVAFSLTLASLPGLFVVIEILYKKIR